MLDPVVDHGAAEDEVLHPAAERLERRVGGALPHGRHVVEDERVVHHLQLLAHHHQALDGLLQLCQRELQARQDRTVKGSPNVLCLFEIREATREITRYFGY